MVNLLYTVENIFSIPLTHLSNISFVLVPHRFRTFSAFRPHLSYHLHITFTSFSQFSVSFLHLFRTLPHFFIHASSTSFFILLPLYFYTSSARLLYHFCTSSASLCTVSVPFLYLVCTSANFIRIFDIYILISCLIYQKTI